MTYEILIKIKDKDNTTLFKRELNIPKPLSCMLNEEIVGLVKTDLQSLSNATTIKVYGVCPSIGDIIFDREMPITETITTPGVKYDKAKPLAGDVLRIFGKAIMGVGQCILKGAEKYPEIDNWKRVKNAERRYTNALVRHLIKHLTGEEIDKESGLPHLQHVVWNALAVCELYLERKTNDK